MHTITLEVQDMAWLTATVSHRVFVLDAPRIASSQSSGPTATLTVNTAFGSAGDTFEFDGTESTGQGLVIGRWDWENDGRFDTAFGTDLSTAHVYTVAGDYTARLQLRDGSGLSDSARQNITVQASEPIALEISPPDVRVTPGETVRFRATAWDMYDNRMRNPEVDWSVTNPLAGTLDASGVFTAGVEDGAYADVILAESGSASDMASVNIAWPYQFYLPFVLKDYPQ